MNLFALPQNAAPQPFSVPLHAMRGIAAFIVLMQHIINIANRGIDPKFSAVFFNGSAAVCFFFILSGLVVGLSLTRKDVNFRSLYDYCIRRVFRIMPLLVVTVTIGGIFIYFVDSYLPYKYYNDILPISKFFLGYVGLVQWANPPSWSIFIEIVGSILLPFMVVTGKNIKHVILCGILLVTLASFNWKLHYTINIFILNFYVGLSILWWGKSFSEIIKKLPSILFWLFVFSCFVVFYSCRNFISPELYPHIANFIEIFAITPFIALVYYCPEKFSMLTRSPFVFLGDVSYSLYLTHYMLIILAINAFAFAMPNMFAEPWLLLVAMTLVLVPIALIVAALSYRYIEKPGIVLGKKFTKQFPFFSSSVAA
jgi:peptidoglycan/LPS O-acetylase OafA/YrhL